MRLPLRFHGTARPLIEPELIQRVALCSAVGSDPFETPSKFAPFDEFLVQKPQKRLRRKRLHKTEEQEVEVRQSVVENSDVVFDDEVEQEEVRLSVIDRCSTSNDCHGVCSICEEEMRDGVFAFSLACAHSFCSEFWLQNVQLSLREERGTAGCMEPNCNHHLTPDAASSLLSQESAQIYRQFVEDHSTSLRKLRCPDCSCLVENTGSQSIACQCGTVLCSSCSSIDHKPVSCSVYAQYRAVRDGKDEKPDIWYPILKNLCKCPYCGEYAVKNGGCQWVHCICSRSYCYICSREWAMNHRPYCNTRKFKVSLIDVPITPPRVPVNPALINRTLAARDLFISRRKELSGRLAILGKVEAAEAMKDLAELTHLLELAVLSSDWNANSRKAESRIRMAFFAFANTSDGNTACLRGKCAQLRYRIQEIKKPYCENSREDVPPRMENVRRRKSRKLKF